MITYKIFLLYIDNAFNIFLKGYIVKRIFFNKGHPVFIFVSYSVIPLPELSRGVLQ